MEIILLGDLQRAYRAQQTTKQRHDLRRYLLERGATSASTYQLVSPCLYADGAIDNIGLADQWLALAGERDRACLFSEIATALLKV
ncbi:MAG: hypothetical protein WCB70_08410 [Xanthobacteraceae bacterium]